MDSQKFSADSVINYQEIQSPFKLPTDEEVFITREAERLKQQEQKERALYQKIWEKQTACTQQQLRRPKDQDFPVELPQQVPIQKHFNQKHRGIITTALEIINARKKQPQRQNKGENIRDFVEQKKEMFHVEMSYRILKEEREKIKKRIENRERALLRNKELMENDIKSFNDHKERNRQQKDEAVLRANAETAVKKEKENKIKQLEQTKAAIQAEIGRNEDYLEALQKHKDFLDKLAPPDWIAEQNRLRQQKYERVRNEWVQRQLSQDANESHLGDTDSQISGGTHSNIQRRRQHAKKTSIQELRDKFDDMHNRGIMEIFTEDDEMMYFTEPEQLMNYLKDIEDSNLFLIELMQELEQQIDNSKSEFERVKLYYEEKCEILRMNQKDYASKNQEHNQKIQQISKRIYNITEQNDSSKAENKLNQDIRRCWKALSGQDDDQSMQPIDILSAIEIEINDLLQDINRAKSRDLQAIENLSREKEEIRRDLFRVEKNRNDQLRQQRKTDAEKARAEAPRFQKHGKPLMEHYKHKKQKKKQTETKVVKSELQLAMEFIENI